MLKKCKLIVLLILICFSSLLFAGGDEPYSIKDDPLFNSLLDKEKEPLKLEKIKNNKQNTKKEKLKPAKRNKINKIKKSKGLRKNSIYTQKALIYKLLEENSNSLKCSTNLQSLVLKNNLQETFEQKRKYKSLLLNIKYEIISEPETLKTFGSLSHIFPDLENKKYITSYDLVDILKNTSEISMLHSAKEKKAIENFIFCIIIPMSKKLNFSSGLASGYYYYLAKILCNLNQYKLANIAYLKSLASKENSNIYEDYIIFLKKYQSQSEIIKILKQYLEYIKKSNPEQVYIKAKRYMKLFKNSDISNQLFKYLKESGYITID